ncbi:MAG: two-component regulator propeller domain-containing protein [Chloroflexota bacterium]|nr:two-component regulator propeller domain-containing protein [Chloroflexota bacterium]
MSNPRSVVYILFIAILVVACSPDSSPGVRPTLAIDETATPTASATVEPTIIPTSTPSSALKPGATPVSPTPTVPVTDTGPFHKVMAIDDIPADDIVDLHATSDGRLWLETVQGILKLQDTTWSPYLTEYKGEMVGLDDLKRVWLVSEDGSQIAAWDGESWSTYGGDVGWEPLAYNDISQQEIVSDNLGQIWIAPRHDVRSFNGERWSILTPADFSMQPLDLENTYPIFTVTFMETTNQVWIGQCDGVSAGPLGGRGVRWFDGARWQGVDSPAGTGCVVAIEEDNDGNIWLGADGDLWRYSPEGDEWTNFPAPEITEGGFYSAVMDITFDPQGDPWSLMYRCGGGGCIGPELYQLHQGTWTQIISYESNLLFGYLYGGELVFDAAGSAWLIITGRPSAGPLGGIFPIGRGEFEPLPGLNPIALTIDAEGQLCFVAEYEGAIALWTLDT